MGATDLAFHLSGRVMVGPRPKTVQLTGIELYHLHAAFTVTGLDQPSGEWRSTGIAVIEPSIS